MSLADFILVFLAILVAAIFTGGLILLFWTELRNEFVSRGILISRNTRSKIPPSGSSQPK
jgi:hypothetical protein